MAYGYACSLGGSEAGTMTPEGWGSNLGVGFTKLWPAVKVDLTGRKRSVN